MPDSQAPDPEPGPERKEESEVHRSSDTEATARRKIQQMLQVTSIHADEAPLTRLSLLTNLAAELVEAGRTPGQVQVVLAHAAKRGRNPAALALKYFRDGALFDRLLAKKGDQVVEPKTSDELVDEVLQARAQAEADKELVETEREATRKVARQQVESWFARPHKGRPDLPTLLAFANREERSFTRENRIRRGFPAWHARAKGHLPREGEEVPWEEMALICEVASRMEKEAPHLIPTAGPQEARRRPRRHQEELAR